MPLPFPLAGAHVVLDRIGEKHRAQEEAGECEAIREPVGAAPHLRPADQLEEAADDCGDWRDCEHDRHHEDRIQQRRPQDLASIHARPEVVDLDPDQDEPSHDREASDTNTKRRGEKLQHQQRHAYGDQQAAAAQT